MNPDDPRHGTSAGYIAGCRGACCWAAKQRYDKQRRWELHTTGQYRKVPTYRALRRIQALQRIGWSVPVIAHKLGLHHQSVYDIGRSPTVYRSRFDKIAALYDDLCMKQPPTETTGQKSGVTKARRHAERMGWPAPLAWDDIDDPDEHPADGPPRRRDSADYDPAVVERILSGDFSVPSTFAERAAVVETWVRRGRSVNELERATGWQPSRYYKSGEAA